MNMFFLALLIVTVNVALFIWWNQRLRIEVQERVKAEKRARENEHRFRMLFENMQQGFALFEIITDEKNTPIDYRYLEMNAAYQKMTGIERSFLIGKTQQDLQPGKPRPWLETFGKVALTSEPQHFEHRSDDSQRWFSVWAFSPSPRQFAVIFSDITEHRIHQEKMQSQNEDMTHFIYTVSHDLKSPLLTISNFSEELRTDLAGDDPQAVYQDLAYIQAASERMRRLLVELQQVASAGSKNLHPTLIPLKELVENVYQANAARYTTRNIQLKITDQDSQLFGDYDRLYQLLQNILDNAAKYMGDQEKPMVEIGTIKQGQETIVYIRDNGQGIAPENTGKVFGIFEKLNKGSEGSGIGLALAKRIVEAHHGRIWATSEGLGRGCTFYFTLHVNEVGRPSP